MSFIISSGWGWRKAEIHQFIKFMLRKKLLTDFQYIDNFGYGGNVIMRLDSNLFCYDTYLKF